MGDCQRVDREISFILAWCNMISLSGFQKTKGSCSELRNRFRKKCGSASDGWCVIWLRIKNRNEVQGGGGWYACGFKDSQTMKGKGIVSSSYHAMSTAKQHHLLTEELLS